MRYQRVLRTLFVLMVSVVSALPASAQSSGNVRFGLFGNLMMNIHSGPFKELPGFPSCCQEYTSGFGLNGGAGVQGSLRISPSLHAGLRIDFSSYGATLSREEIFPVVVLPADKLEEGTIEHTIDAQLPAYGFEPILMYQRSELMLWAGPRISYISDNTFQQREEILSPDAAVFEDTRRKVRNERDGHIPTFEPMQVGFTLGASYDIPLNKQHTVLLQPQITFFHNFTSMLTDLEWQAHAIRIGVGLSFVPEKQPPALVDTAASPLPSDPAPEPLPTPLQAQLRVSVRDRKGNAVDTVHLVVDETIATRMHPLLPYIFFDANSAELPKRYAVRGSQGAASFSPERITDTNSVDVYRHALDIIGYRLRAKPSRSITVTGTTSGRDNVSDIAVRRAEVVSNYLINAWGIGPSRIRVTSRGMPEVSSSEQEPDGIEENSRVEITSSDASVFDPIVLVDTMRTVTPPAVMLLPTTNRTGIDEWYIDAALGNTPIKHFEGRGNPPASMIWNAQENVQQLMDNSRPLSARLHVSDSTETASSVVDIPRDVLSLTTKRIERRGIYAYDRYDLILFEFDQWQSTPLQKRTIDVVSDRIDDNSIVYISGYTDRVGSESHNLELSDKRANSVLKTLGKKAEVRAMGESTEHDFSSPEGRFYARMVRIEVLTPADR